MNLAVLEHLKQVFRMELSPQKSFMCITAERIDELIKETLHVDDFTPYKDEIRKSLSDFFAKEGFKSYIFFKSKNRLALTFKVFDFEHCTYTRFLLHSFPDLEKFLIPAESKKDVFLLHQKITTAFYQALKVVEDEEQKKEVLRAVLKQGLALQPRDAIFFVGGGIMIKKFQENEIGAQRRMFDGLSEESLQFLERQATKEGFDSKLTNLIHTIAENELDFSRFDNLYFAKNFIKVLQEKFLLLLPKAAMQEEITIQQGYANYLLRQNFDKTLLLLSKELLQKLVAKDRKAETFVRFYNGETTFSPDGRRFQKPDILDANSGRWNSATLFQVVMQRKIGLEKIAHNAEDIDKTKDIIHGIKEHMEKIRLMLIEQNEKIAKFEKDFRTITARSSELKNSLFILKQEALKQKNLDRQAQINTLAIEIKRVEKEEEIAHKERKLMSIEIERGQIKLVTLEKDLLAFEKKLERNIQQKDALLEKQVPLDERYEVVAKALAKALSGFRGY